MLYKVYLSNKMCIEVLYCHPRNTHIGKNVFGQPSCEKVNKKIVQLYQLSTHWILRIDHLMDAFQQKHVSRTAFTFPAQFYWTTPLPWHKSMSLPWHKTMSFYEPHPCYLILILSFESPGFALHIKYTKSLFGSGQRM